MAASSSSVFLSFSSRIVAARLNGSLDFFSLETHTSLSPLQFRGQQALYTGVGAGIPARCLLNLLTEFVSLGTPGRGSSPSSSVYSSSNTVACHLTHTVPCAHQKPITALRAAAGRLVTGSQDHTLRVCIVYLWALVSWKGGEEEGPH